MLRMILMGVQVFVCFGIVGLVLLQRGKGADAGAGFGAGASGTVFGARGARTALSRTTAILAAVFMLNSLALAYMGSQQAAAPKTILDEAAGTTAPEPANGAGQTPVVPAPATGNSAPAPAPSTTPAPANTPAPAEIPAPANGPEKK
ncbi:MAG TPA: preprotein translocase subunit SecG [Steroidobacteraceae bacterium]|nr:preprotein translocase subunit SecG [Steroidobacteraceae bacterium]